MQRVMPYTLLAPAHRSWNARQVALTVLRSNSPIGRTQ